MMRISRYTTSSRSVQWSQSRNKLEMIPALWPGGKVADECILELVNTSYFHTAFNENHVTLCRRQMLQVLFQYVYFIRPQMSLHRILIDLLPHSFTCFEIKYKFVPDVDLYSFLFLPGRWWRSRGPTYCWQQLLLKISTSLHSVWFKVEWNMTAHKTMTHYPTANTHFVK